MASTGDDGEPPSKRIIIAPKQYMTNERLIEEVRSRPELWDESEATYRDKHKKTVAWNNIAKMFIGGSPHDLAKTWFGFRRSLNNCRNRHCKKYGASGSAGVPYKPYKYEKLMLFLDGYRGKDVMEGNLEGSRIHDISDEPAVVEAHGELESDTETVEASGESGSEAEARVNQMSAMEYSMNVADASVEGIAASTPNGKPRLPLGTLSFNGSSSGTPSGKLIPSVSHLSFNSPPSASKRKFFSTAPVKEAGAEDKENLNILVLPRKPLTKKVQLVNRNNGNNGTPPPSSQPQEPMKPNHKVEEKLRNKSKAVVSLKSGPPETPAARRARLKKEKQEKLDKDREEVTKKLEMEVENATKLKAREKKSVAGEKSVKHGTCTCSNAVEEAILMEIKKPDDPVTLFLLSMGDSLRALPPHKCRLFQMQSLEALTALELQTQGQSLPAKPVGQTVPPPAQPMLSLEQMAEAKTVLQVSDDEQVSVLGHLLLRGRDMKTLTDGMWLNDMVINAYFTLLMAKSNSRDQSMYAFDTYFLEALLNPTMGFDHVEKWVIKLNVDVHRCALLPLHDADHWSLIVVDIQERKLTYCCSFRHNKIKYLNALSTYFDRKWNLAGWTFDIAQDMPLQSNGYDCGVFVCTYAYCITSNTPINFTEADMPHLRLRMVYELAHTQLL